MGKKPRSQRRKKGGASDGGGGSEQADEADYLSEGHTIATQGTEADGNDDSINGDDYWDINDDLVGDEANTSDDNAVAKAERRQEKLVDCLETLSEYPSEKRSAKREQLLKSYFKGLTQYATLNYNPIHDQRDELIQACQYGLRNGAPSEQYAACRVLEATAVLIGSEDYYQEISILLKRIVESSHRAIPVRIAALRALGMAVFIGVDDDEITEHVLDLCEQLAQTEHRGNTVPFALRGTALDVWTLLSTTIHELYVAGKDEVSTGRGLLLLPLLLSCLEQSDDSNLRSAAGECVAYIHTARLNLGVDETTTTSTNNNNANGGSDNQEKTATERKYSQGSWEGSEWEDTMAEMEQIMDELSNQSGHYMSKRAKKEQRATFREYLATLQDNEPPDHTVQFRGGSLELNSWRDICALNFIRRCLQGGFQIQLLTNPTLQAIFGADGQALSNSANAGYSQLEKRLLLSKTSEVAKAKDLDRHKKRNTRTNVKNHFLTADGEDI